MDTIRDYRVTFHLVIMSPYKGTDAKVQYENHVINFVLMLSDLDMIELFETLLRTPFNTPKELMRDGDDRLYMFYLFIVDQIATSISTVAAEKLQIDPLGFCFLDTEFLGMGSTISEDASEDLKRDLDDWRVCMLTDPRHHTRIVIQDSGVSAQKLH